MQLKDVKVATGTDGFSSVLFVGQGGESIDVRLATGEAGGDPVARARAVMTQIASFDLGAGATTQMQAQGDPGASATAPAADRTSGDQAAGPAGDVWSRPGTRAPLPDRDG